MTKQKTVTDPAAAVAEPAADVPTAEPPPAVALPIMTVRCARQRGVWRAGRFWPAEAVVVLDDELSAEQIDAVCAEPLLVVTTPQAADTHAGGRQ